MIEESVSLQYNQPAVSRCSEYGALASESVDAKDIAIIFTVNHIRVDAPPIVPWEGRL